MIFGVLSLGLAWGQLVVGGNFTPPLSRITAVDGANAALTVDDISLFAPGDEVLIIQMQGAVIDASNSTSFGDIINRNGAGSYEFNTVCLTEGTTSQVTLSSPLANSYATTNVAEVGLQLVKVETFGDLAVNTTLTADAWNGQTGGILVLASSGTITLNADIDMSEKGFRGGAFVNEPGSPTCFSWAPLGSGLNPTYPAYYYNSQNGGGQKGEGIADFITGRNYGRGKQATGGGGGNDHNAGGGGGANWGSGGIGSDNTRGACTGSHPGVGGEGQAASYTTGNVLFMGSGGGAGHANNNEGRDGGNGGGIIIIRANHLIGNGHSIVADGETVFKETPPYPSIFDGVGGGGAGGTILLRLNSLDVSGLTTSVRGGDGGNTNSYDQCEGPGGGGGGGVVLTTLGAWTATVDVAGGAAGIEISTTGSCSPNAAAGGNGNLYLGYAPLIATGTNSSCGVTLQAQVNHFSAQRLGRDVLLDWQIDRPVPQIALQRQDDQGRWRPLHQTDGEARAQQWLDQEAGPARQVYRLALHPHDGRVVHSQAVEVPALPQQALSFQLWPNPAQDAPVSLHLQSTQALPWQVEVLDLTGRSIWQQSMPAETHRLTLPQHWPAGYYQVRVRQGGQQAQQALIKGG